MLNQVQHDEEGVKTRTAVADRQLGVLLSNPLRTEANIPISHAHGSGSTYAIITFLVGVILLLGWLYATAGNPRSVLMLRKSFLFFAVPIMLAPDRWFPLGMWFFVACEEALKAFASTREQDRVNKFWFVCLFGIWELTIDKPVWGFVVSHSHRPWDSLAMAGLVYTAALPVLTHVLTAAIYAFTFERRLWAAFVASWIIHFGFNLAVRYYPSAMGTVIETTTLVILLTVILGRYRQPGIFNRR